MRAAGTARSTTRRAAMVLAIVFIASYAYFYEGGGWNQNTRFDLVRAIVERHTLQIDAYHENTGDKAHAGDHYYSDKAPGASLVAIVPVALVRWAMVALGRDALTAPSVIGLSYVATVAASAFPAVIAALCVFWISLRLGAGDTAAAFAAVVCGLGTPMWPYATLLYGHTLAGGCLMATFLGAWLIAEATTPRDQVTRGLWTGLAAGWAVVTEYPAIIPGAMILGFALWQLRRSGRASLVRIALAVGAGLAVSAMVLLGYNWLAFGAPFHIGYTSEEGFEAMRTGIFGVNWPKAEVAWELLFGEFRGLLPLAPVLAVAPVGFWFLWRDRAARAAGVTTVTIVVYYFLLTAGYAYWNGGWSYGSRHLGPALPFLCLGIAPVWQRSATLVRALILSLALVSVGEALVAVTTTSQPPFQYKRPMREVLWPAFVSGDFPIGWQSVLERDAPGEPMSQLERDGVPRQSWNLGQLIGLTGHMSLLPLLMVWAIGAWVWATGRQAPRAASAARAR